MTYITAAETNKFIRQALADTWPKVKFRVYLTSGGRSANVEWWDGPTVEEVEQVTRNFQGETFDGMTDMASPVYGIHPVTKERVHWGTNYVFEKRLYTVPFYTQIVKTVCDRYGLPLPEIKTHSYDKSAYIDQDHSFYPGHGTHTLCDLVYQESRKFSDGSSAKAEPKTSSTKKAYNAVKVEGGWEIHNTDIKDAELFQKYKATLGFRWNKDDRKDRFWWCPVEKLPEDIQALVDGTKAEEEALSIEPLPSNSPADKFREMAAALQPQIDAKRNPATAHQNPTRRRNSIIESMAQDADNLERLQTAFIKLAFAWDDDTLAQSLRGVTTRGVVEYLLKYDTMPGSITEKDNFKRMVKAGIGTPMKYSEAKYAMKELMKDAQPKEMTVEQKIAAIKRDLIGGNIEGFIPTPEAIVEQMVNLADIRSGMTVLEPSAGWGNIADGIKKAHPETVVHCVEFILKLRDILELKGHELVAHNIFQYDVPREQMYDRILMNPPFEGEQDIEHVQYVYEQHLKDGGRMVAIMSEHAFFANTKQSKAFRQWLEDLGASDEKLPPDAFQKNGYRATGVQTRMVVIDKPFAQPLAVVVKEIDPLVKAQRDYAAAIAGDDMERMKVAARVLREAIQAKKELQNG